MTRREKIRGRQKGMRTVFHLVKIEYLEGLVTRCRVINLTPSAGYTSQCRFLSIVSSIIQPSITATWVFQDFQEPPRPQPRIYPIINLILKI